MCVVLRTDERNLDTQASERSIKEIKYGRISFYELGLNVRGLILFIPNIYAYNEMRHFILYNRIMHFTFHSFIVDYMEEVKKKNQRQNLSGFAFELHSFPFFIRTFPP